MCVCVCVCVCIYTYLYIFVYICVLQRKGVATAAPQLRAPAEGDLLGARELGLGLWLGLGRVRVHP